MRETIAVSITSTVEDLHKSGIINEITMKNIQNLCIVDVKQYTLFKSGDRGKNALSEHRINYWI